MAVYRALATTPIIEPGSNGIVTGFTLRQSAIR
jgi:hypothetical protein